MLDKNMGINQIPTGAYVIRASQTSTVLQIQDTTLAKWSWAVVSEQNENNYRDQQIWWIEPFPKDDNDDSDVLYSITNTSSGKALGLRKPSGMKGGLRGKGTWVTACPADGTLCQGWKIQRGQSGHGKMYYTLANADSGSLLDIATTKLPDSTEVQWGFSKEYISERTQQCWEFVIPKVAFPCGWFQIQNPETGALLSHTYLTSPPVLVDPRHTTLSAQYRESWDTQWTLIHAKSYAPNSPCTTGENTWCIRNRLTEGFLGNTACKLKDTFRPAITGMESCLLPVEWGTKFKSGINIAEYTWSLELDLNRNWNIINHNTLCLLEPAQEPSNGRKTGVACVNRQVTRNSSWALTLPVARTEKQPGPRSQCQPPCHQQCQHAPPAYRYI